MKKFIKSKLVDQTNNNDYDERIPIYMPSRCDLCCCQSCTGFNCPWVKGINKYKSSGNKNYAARCDACKRNDFSRIYDCDFYTYYRRRKFFKPKKFKRRKTKLDIINEKLDIIMKNLGKL